MSGRANHHMSVVCLLALATSLGNTAAAQTGLLRTLVRDTSGRPISNAEIRISTLRMASRTDSVGRVSFSAVPKGEYDVSVRRMGYGPMMERVTVHGDDDTLRVTMLDQPLELDGFSIEARRHPFFAGFEQRRAQGVGTFVTRADIDAQASNTPSDIFRSLQGVRLVSAGSGMGVRFASAITSIRSGPQMCAPMIWLDGQRAAGLEIDDIRSSDIEAIEMYRGASTTPPQFATAGITQCGAVVVWTRRRK